MASGTFLKVKCIKIPDARNPLLGNLASGILFPQLAIYL
jgi:hypothetical protein